MKILSNNRRFLLGAIAFVAASLALGPFHHFYTVPDRPVKLTITGPSGQRFSGSYTANGSTHTLSGIVPATIGVSAKEVQYQFKPEDSRREFRVVLAVEELPRTSFCSYQGGSVRGGWHFWGSGESAW